MKLFAYKAGSASAKALADALGIKRLKHVGKVVHGTVINWGSSNVTREVRGDIINRPVCVSAACNKLVSFQSFQEAGVATPAFTYDRSEACEWLLDGDVVARTILNGHSGQGIVIMHNHGEFTEAPLYTKYIKKDQEYRIHVFQGEAFFVQRKARKLEVPNEEVNWKVRNLDGGFIYANKDVEIPEVYKQEAISAVASLGLDFGACDLITEKNTGLPFVLEVNTACGLAGTTLDKYVEQFQKVAP